MNYLRKMAKGDLKDTFRLRNDQEVCYFAQAKAPITWAEHVGIFKHTDYPKLCYIDGESNQIIGFVEFRNDIKSDDPDVKIWGFHLDKDFRGKGLANDMLDLALKEAKNLGIKKIIAYVKHDNVKSIHLHEKLGFLETNMDDMEITYELEVK